MYQRAEIGRAGKQTLHRHPSEFVGAGVALLPEKSFAFEVQTGSLVKIEMADKELRRPIGIIYRTGKHFGAPAEKLMEYLRGQDAGLRRRSAKGDKQKASAL